MNSQKEVKYEISRGCVLCMECIHACPEKAISMGNSGMEIKKEKCIGCGLCYRNCAFEAIRKIEFK